MDHLKLSLIEKGSSNSSEYIFYKRLTLRYKHYTTLQKKLIEIQLKWAISHTLGLQARFWSKT